MQKRKGGTRIKHSAAAALLSLLLLACLPGSSAGAAVRGTDSPAPRLLLSAAPDSPADAGGASGAAAAAATDLLLCLESAPRRFALLLRLEVPDGWRLNVSAGEIPLASRRLSDSSLLLLLDGQTASASPVLARLTVTRPPGASGCVRVLPNPDDPSIYYWKETENMPDAMPAATSDATSDAIPAAARLAACGFLLPEAGGSATAAPPETATPPETTAPPEPPTGDAEYIGCQEATGASGDLCVRFLFRVPAGGDACAAVWIAGYAPVGSAPGAGRLAISRMSSVRTGARGVYAAGAGSFLLAYTYTGLPSSGELVFALRDGSGVLRSAVYRDGAFAGYCD
ncbi:MAG: hypothetical protein MRZ53_05180 [Oscillospiraceae bacterium]|nr:hypothetical protein [Oscillospiraceae bacterium]